MSMSKMLIALFSIGFLIFEAIGLPSVTHLKQYKNSQNSTTDGEKGFKTKTKTIQDYAYNVWERSREFEGGITMNMDKTRSKRNIAKNRLWPDGIVPIQLSYGFSKWDVLVIKTSMNILEKIYIPFGVEKECGVKFVRRGPADTNYVTIVKGAPGDCWSYVGMQDTPQKISLGDGCVSTRTVVHELLHTLGFYHQQSSSNRDNFVDIHKDNIQTGQYYDNFEKLNDTEVTDFNLPYDYDSIMQYSSYLLAKEYPDRTPVGPTITKKKPKGGLIYSNEKLTKTDKLKLLYMYCKKAIQYYY